MAFWSYSTTVEITEDTTTIETTLQNRVLRDSHANSAGDYNTWYSNTIAAHKAAALAEPSLESTRIRVDVAGGWIATGSSNTVTTNAVALRIPASGVVLLQLNPTFATAQYKINSGPFITFTNGTSITLTDGDTLTFQGLNVNTIAPVVGSVIDVTNNMLVDYFNLNNSL